MHRSLSSSPSPRPQGWSSKEADGALGSLLQAGVLQREGPGEISFSIPDSGHFVKQVGRVAFGSGGDLIHWNFRIS